MTDQTESLKSESAEVTDWERLAPMALVFMLLATIQKFVRENLFLFAGAGFGVAVFDFLDAWKLALLAFALFLIGLVSTMIYHRRFRFRIEDDAVRVRRGLLEKKELRVRFARVQSVQIGQPFYFKPFDLVRFTLETPGGQQSEVELPGIPKALAESMRDRIIGLQDVPPPVKEHHDDQIEQEDQRQNHLIGSSLYSASAWQLFRHGLSSNQIWLLAGLAAWFFGSFSERFGDWASDQGWFNWVTSHFDQLWLFAGGAVLAGLAFLLALSGLLAIVRFYGFRLSDRGDRLVGVGGLLDQREQTVKREKITGLTVKQSALGRLLRCWQIVIRQTSSIEVDMPGQKKSFIVPGLYDRDRALVSDLVPNWTFPGQDDNGDDNRHYNRHDSRHHNLHHNRYDKGYQAIHHRFRRVFWKRSCAVAIALIGLWVWRIGSGLLEVLLPLTILLVILAGIHIRWRQWGWSIRDHQLWVRQGFLGRSHDVFDLDRVQQAQIRQSRYQRRHELANLVLVLPQGPVTVPYLSLDDAANLANQAIYAAETSSMHRV